MIEEQKKLDKSDFATETRTWRFYSVDVNYMLNVGSSPKEVFRRGCMAMRDHPQLISRIKEQEDNIAKMQNALRRMYEANDTYKKRVEELESK